MKQSNRATQWANFSLEVYNHIENYTVPQYGDFPNDQANNFKVRDVVQNMRRYLNRMETNQRGTVERHRDCYKLAHYACILMQKIMEEEE